MNDHFLEPRLSTLEKTVAGLFDLQREQAKVNSNLEKTIALLQQSHEEFEGRFNRELTRYESETIPKVTTLWDGRSQTKGGFAMIKDLVSLAGWITATTLTVWLILRTH